MDGHLTVLSSWPPPSQRYRKPPEKTIGLHHVATALEVTNYFIWYPHKIYGMPLTLKEF